MTDLRSATDLPDGFDYPPDFVRIVELGLTNLEPWHILEGETLHRRANGLKDRFPQSQLVPFARRQDNDDVACWDLASRDRVVVVHDFSRPGTEERVAFGNFAHWFRQAIEDLHGFE